MNIGFFDSGLGGLLVLKAVAKALPQYDYIYYGDTANLPYGDDLTKKAIGELFARDCVIVIVACNTASVETIRRLQDTYLKEEFPEKKILGVIVPTVEEVVEGGYSRAVLIATKRTIESGKYERELNKLDSTIALTSVATPELVPLIELGEDEAAISTAIRTLEREAREGDVAILGCTHYILLKDALRNHFGNRLVVISQDEVIPKKLSDYLNRHPEITSQLTNTGKREIVLTKHRPDYDCLTAEFLGGVYMPEEPE
jgi:glutamate racemase